MRIVIIGAVAAGTSAGAKARRNNEEATIVLYERDRHISYSGCGMPYRIGGEVSDTRILTPRDPTYFKKQYNIDVKIRNEVQSIDPHKKTLEIVNLETGEKFTDFYDTLVLATGACPVIPPIRGTNRTNVFVLRNITDMDRIVSFISERNPQTAAIIGTGFIGLEVCENMTKQGIAVTLIEKLPQVSAGLDPDMAILVKEHIQKHQIPVYTGVIAKEITEEGVFLSDGRMIPSDMVLLATGVRPESELAREAGIALGVFGAIKVDRQMKTSIPGIYACGDCTEQFHRLTGKAVYRPLGSTANKTGRIVGENITGGNEIFEGILGTGIFRVFDLTVAQTGLSEREAREEGFDPVVCHNIKPDRPEYLGGKEMVIKAVADRNTGKLLGVQIIGPQGVDKRIDVFVTAISLGADVRDLIHLDLAYAPPFSTTKDPVMYTGMILDNAIRKGRPLITASDLDRMVRLDEKVTLIDARVPEQYGKHHIPTAQSIPHGSLREKISLLEKDTVTVTYCNKGNTGNASQNVLLNKGFRRVYNLSGGHRQFTALQRESTAKQPNPRKNADH
jgi:NADPH-dependent 2,4-dienoyl-CoA reductase/sulfur reductase-like enzyme/rhodanese-related sulfurtransferase